MHNKHFHHHRHHRHEMDEAFEDEQRPQWPPWARHNRGFRRGFGRHFSPRRGGPFGGPGFGGPGFGPGFGGPGFGGPGDPEDGPRRQRRGDMKFAVLEVIADQPRHGYDVIKELEQRYSGFYRPSPGSVYPTLQLLEDEGLASSTSEGGKRIYTITEAGQQQLAEWQQRQQQEGGRRGFGHGRPRVEMLRLHKSIGGLMGVVGELGRHGTQEQINAAIEQIDATRRALYGLLASDEGSKDDVI